MPSNSNGRNADTLNISIDEAPPPPYSETDIYSNSGGPRSPNSASSGRPAIASDNASRISSSSTGDVILTPPETPRPSASPLQPAASYFFSTRPPPAADAPGVTIDHALDVRRTSVPQDFPYKAEFAGRDVSAQDWATFVNFLLPDHASRGNEAVIDRKLRAEGSDAGRSGGTPSHAEQQLEDLRERAAESPEAVQQRSDVEATVRQWNEQFFLPRGVNIRLLPLHPSARMPGSWDSNFDRSAPQAEAGTSAPPQTGRRTSGLGKLQMDEDGIRYGDSFIMDANQVRLGNIVLDANGIRTLRPGESSRGVGAQAQGRGFPYQGYQQQPPTGMPNHSQGWDERGRQPQISGVTQPRERSASSHSASSCSSSSSESSIGSLPSYNDVRDQQLPLYTARLATWLERPDELRTKAEVKQLKAELRESKARAPTAKPLEQDVAELRLQAKVVEKQWKQLKKRQRGLRRERRKERRQRRKAERKERKQRRKEMKGAQRDLRRGRAQPPMPPLPAQATVPSMPSMPSGSSMPSMPSMPPMPHMPHMPSGWGQPRRCHPGGGRGSIFGAQPFGPSFGPFSQHGSFDPRGPFGGRGGRGSRGGGRGGFRNQGGPFNPFGHPQGNPSQAPGAWPGDNKAEPEESVTPPPGPASAELYRTVERLETEVSRKQATVTEVKNKADRAAVEQEIEALTRSLEAIRMSADEAYARELSSEDYRY